MSRCQLNGISLTTTLGLGTYQKVHLSKNSWSVNSTLSTIPAQHTDPFNNIHNFGTDLGQFYCNVINSIRSITQHVLPKLISTEQNIITDMYL